jgi:hypothetical protein
MRMLTRNALCEHAEKIQAAITLRNAIVVYTFIMVIHRGLLLT